jgi:hypothetical protein
MAVELLNATTQAIHQNIQFEVRPWNIIKHATSKKDEK